MSRSMLSPVAALAVGVSSLPLTRTTQPGTSSFWSGLVRLNIVF